MALCLDLRYEYRDVPQDLSSQDRVDQWFDVKTRGLSSRAKAKLKEKWGTMQKVYSSRSRLEKVAWDIIQDFNMKPRLMDGNGNAILVADGIPTACKYYEIFQQMGFKKCAIISSYTPNKGELRTDTVSDEDDTETFLKYETYLKMLGLDPSDLPNAGSVQAKVEEFEKEAKRKFVEEPANMKLLIVVGQAASLDLMRLLVPTFTSTRGCRITACFRRFAASTVLMMIVRISAISWITSSCLDSSRLQ